VTILSVCQAVAPVVGIATPSQVFGSDDADAVQLSLLANEMGERIARAAEWQKLKVLHTLTGDGTTTAFALPSDFDRFPKKQEMRSSVRLSTGFTHVTDHDVWLDWSMMDFAPVLGAWTLLGGQVQFLQALASAELAKFYYFSNKWAASSGGDYASTFTSDSDTFLLNERTLRLSMIAQWRVNKGMDPEPHASVAGQALADDIARDKGPQSIKVGQPRMPRGVTLAYPMSITE
jgi:hypothetical protein